jgi:hypothetical protein
LCRHSASSFFECDFQVVAKVRAALRRRATRAAATTAKHVTKTKQVAKDVFDSAEAGCTPRSATAGTAGNACMSKSVVTLTLLCIGEHAVSFGRFLKLVFRG